MGELLKVLLAINGEYGAVGILVALLIGSGWIVAGFASWRLIANTKQHAQDKAHLIQELRDTKEDLLQVSIESTKVLSKLSERFEVVQNMLLQFLAHASQDNKRD